MYGRVPTSKCWRWTGGASKTCSTPPIPQTEISCKSSSNAERRCRHSITAWKEQRHLGRSTVGRLGRLWEASQSFPALPRAFADSWSTRNSVHFKRGFSSYCSPTLACAQVIFLFCKPLVGSSNLSPGTTDSLPLLGLASEGQRLLKPPIMLDGLPANLRMDSLGRPLRP